MLHLKTEKVAILTQQLSGKWVFQLKERKALLQLLHDKKNNDFSALFEK